MKIVLPTIGTPSLLDRVQERLDVEGNLRQLRKQRLKERGNVVYIPPQAKASLLAPDEARFSLMEKVMESLVDNRKVFLLLGDSGSGKSTFTRELECQLWKSYKKGGPIPLHITLPAVDKPEHDLIAKQLRKVEFTEPQIRELKLYRKFILICDGYDESQQTYNLFISNRLNEPGEWSAKMIISCRSEYLGADYRDRFQPGDRNRRSEASLLQEAVITPFSLVQVQGYITQYVSVHRPLWEADQYKKALDCIPSLKELVRNPFLMSLTLEVLPRMVNPGQNLSATRITRVALYDQFIEHWLERGKKRLGEKHLNSQARAAFESLSDEGFTLNGIDFLKRLSAAIYMKQGGQPIVRYSRYHDEGSWKSEFFSREDEKQLLREACPLIRSGNQHRFIHRTLLEYGLSLAIFDPQDRKAVMVPESTFSRRGSASSNLSFIIRDTVEEEAGTTGMRPDLGSPLAWRNFVNDPSVLQFLEERVQQEPVFKQLLLDYVEYSKVDKNWRTAAANAITILVRAGMQFNCSDLQGIQIPGADISYGVFELAQLQGADLRHVNLRGTWLRHANVSKARMDGVRFGELPFLTPEGSIISCAYSPDGKSFAMHLSTGQIIVYSTSTWEALWASNDHTLSVSSLSYSPTSGKIASGSFDKTVRLWDVRTGACRQVLTGHTDEVHCVAYSPCGNQVASASSKTIRLWDVDTGECRRIFVGHSRLITRIIYSPDGKQLTSCSRDTTVRLWNVEDGGCYELSGHGDSVRSVAYSPQGDQLVSASDDETLRLWDVATAECLHVLKGHNDNVNFATYSPNGTRIASASKDTTVRLWDTRTGRCLFILAGHMDRIISVAYSPGGDQVVSASGDNTVRLWDPETGVCRQSLFGHTGRIKGVLYSLKGDQVASYSDDNTVRLWDVNAGSPRHISNGHGRRVWSVKFSPRGDRVASCSDDRTVRIWDVKTGICCHTLNDRSDEVQCMAFSPQGSQVALANRDGTIRLWDVGTGECHRTLIGHTKWALRMVYSSNGKQLASCSWDATVRLWDVEAGVCSHILRGHTNWVRSVAYSPQENKLVSASDDNTLRLWDITTGLCLLLTGHTERVYFATYSPNGNQIASASGDKTVRLWDIETGMCLHVLTGHSGLINSIAYSPGGDQVASASVDCTVRLWDTVTGTESHVLAGHGSQVLQVTYSPHGDLIASFGHNDTVRLWDPASGNCRGVIQGTLSDVYDIAWKTTSNVNYLVAGCDDGSVRMWQAVNDEDHYDVHLRWRTTNGELSVRGASMLGVQGLSQLNRQLLEQRGAVDEPTGQLRATNQVVTIEPVTTRFSPPPQSNAEDSSLEDDIPNTFADQSELQTEQTIDSRPLRVRRCTL